jgi:hypothetical protein
VLGAEPADLVFEVGLGVDPRAGDTGVAGNGFESEHGAGPVEFVHRRDRLGAGVFVPPPGGTDEMDAVVSPHVSPSLVLDR